MVAPRYATPADPDRPSYAAGTGVLGARLGWPAMQWQATASQLVGEYDPATGLRVHPFVVVTVPRQAGKTSWALTECARRCLTPSARPARVWYTAQTGQAAREKWDVLAGALPARWSRRTNGSERTRFPDGSQFRPFPPTRDALHGEQSDLVIVDEAWTLDRWHGEQLMQAIGPTQATRPGAQVIVVSTAGTDASTWLRSLIDRGRAGDPSVCYLEYSIPDDVDPLDVPELARWHPAVGDTIGVDFLQTQAAIMADAPGEYARAYGNRWTATAERVIAPAVWARAIATRPMPDGRPVFAADVAADRTRAAIVACNDGVLELVRSAPGVEWIVGELLALVDKHRPAAVVVDRYGPSAALADQLEHAGVTLFPTSGQTYAAACQSFLDRIGAGTPTLTYRMAPELDAAVDAAATRAASDGAWVWSRRLATAPICELVAATWAAWADQHRPPTPPRPAVLSLSGRR